MRQLLIALLFFATSQSAQGEGEQAGDFDYYVLALSWSPNWCALEGNAREAEQCEQVLGWVVHGLWPQYEYGWPSYCRSYERSPSRSLTASQADLFGAGGAAWYQWKKHGICSGLSAQDYYRLAREAFARIKRPEVLTRLERAVKLPASVIEDAFLEANPSLTADMITITCKDSHIQEARICLTRDLEPRVCGADVARDCSMQDALFEPIK